MRTTLDVTHADWGRDSTGRLVWESHSVHKRHTAAIHLGENSVCGRATIEFLSRLLPLCAAVSVEEWERSCGAVSTTLGLNPSSKVHCKHRAPTPVLAREVSNAACEKRRNHYTL